MIPSSKFEQISVETRGRCIPFPHRKPSSWWQHPPVLNPTVVGMLRANASELHQQFASMNQMCVAIPGPTEDDLKALPIPMILDSFNTLLTILRVQDSSPDLSIWINEACSLAERTAVGFDEGLSSLQRLYYLRPTTMAYSRCLSGLRRCIADISTNLGHLVAHFDAYLAWARTPLEDGSIEPPNIVAGVERSALPERIWHLGRQAGLREAEDLVHAAFIPEFTAVPYANPPASVLLQSLLEDLRARIDSEPVLMKEAPTR